MLDAVTDKLQAFPGPETVEQLQAYLGLLGFWRNFIPHMAQLAKPLHRLVRKGETWDWTPESEQAFVATKQAVAQGQTL